MNCKNFLKFQIRQFIIISSQHQQKTCRKEASVKTLVTKTTVQTKTILKHDDTRVKNDKPQEKIHHLNDLLLLA